MTEENQNNQNGEAVSAESLAAAAQEDVQQAVAEAHQDAAGAEAEGVTNDDAAAPTTEGAEETASADGAEASEASAAAEGGEGTEGEAEQSAEDAAMAAYKARLRQFMRALKKLPGEWYIIQCYSGYENKVKTNLDMRAQTLEVEDSIFEVVVPVEQAIEKKDGKKKVVKRKLLPGYVLVRMELNDAAWSVVRDTPGVTSFVGNEGNATPVKIRDVAKFLMPNDPTVSPEASAADSEGEQVVAMPEKEAAKAYAHDFEVGEAVTILSGPLASVSATISEIDPETGKMQGLVSIFGRETPVELSPTEIERIS